MSFAAGFAAAARLAAFVAAERAVGERSSGERARDRPGVVASGSRASPPVMCATDAQLRVERRDDVWVLAGAGFDGLRLVNEFLGYLADRNYAPLTVRAYAFDLLHFARWMASEQLSLEAVDTDVLLRYLTACRTQVLAHQRGANVFSIRDGRNVGYAPRTVNRRLAALAGLFALREMRDPTMRSPIPRRRDTPTRTAPGQRAGLLGHVAPASATQSGLRLREPRRLPRGLRRDEVAELLASFLTVRDRAIAGLMLFSGLRSAEVRGLAVDDVDIALGWVRVLGKGEKERRVPVDREVCALVQSYLLRERPDSASRALFVVAKGPTRGQPLTAAGLRSVFRYHRARCGVPAGNPHALRHTFGTALAEAGVDLPVMQALLGHDHVDSALTYVHLAPAHVRAAYDAARARQH
jgi:site-specific recombinase XerD